MIKDDLIESDWSEEDRRAYERYSVEFYLCVYNRDTGILIGHVVDISLGGIQLLSEVLIADDDSIRLRMDVSLESGKKDIIEFEARKIWQAEDLNPGFYNTGFQFLDLSLAAVNSVQAIINEIDASL
ncbi:MAG TPA: PilZ domain-containing protein [Candidatus Competibacter sp.]|nr:PilZ domain-containing protein [Candidatus Competibacter sp.]